MERWWMIVGKAEYGIGGRVGLVGLGKPEVREQLCIKLCEYSDIHNVYSKLILKLMGITW